MSGGWRPLSPADKQKKERARKTIDIACPSRELYQTTGNVIFSIPPTPSTVIYVLEKEIAPMVAARLAKLETVNEIFNLDTRANAILINEFLDAVSLGEILVLGSTADLTQSNCKMLVIHVGTPH
ncbi:hypothetical protein AALT_g11050 [Alternaria alternata]|nr:hypothetical protein AALT_g11050 [Alternaria alternata]